MLQYHNAQDGLVSELLRWCHFHLGSQDKKLVEVVFLLSLSLWSTVLILLPLLWCNSQQSSLCTPQDRFSFSLSFDIKNITGLTVVLSLHGMKYRSSGRRSLATSMFTNATYWANEENGSNEAIKAFSCSHSVQSLSAFKLLRVLKSWTFEFSYFSCLFFLYCLLMTGSTLEVKS